MLGLSTFHFMAGAFLAALVIHQILFLIIKQAADYLSVSVFITVGVVWFLTKDLTVCAFSTFAAFIGHFLSVGITQKISDYKNRPARHDKY